MGIWLTHFASSMIFTKASIENEIGASGHQRQASVLSAEDEVSDTATNEGGS